jgi:hypothetical protein
MSGGQTGADRAALDFAIEHGIPHGGWCPKGRLAEDGPIDGLYLLTETPTSKYPQRAEPEVQRLVERLFLIEVVSFDWNCQKHITPRYTASEIQELIAPLKVRIAELEAKLKDKESPP